MVFRIYVIILCIGILGLLLQFIFKRENKESPSNILLKILKVFEKLNNIWLGTSMLFSVLGFRYKFSNIKQETEYMNTIEILQYIIVQNC